MLIEGLPYGEKKIAKICLKTTLLRMSNDKDSIEFQFSDKATIYHYHLLSRP